MKQFIIPIVLVAVLASSVSSKTLTPAERKALVRRQFLGSFYEKTGTSPDKLHEARVFRIQNNDTKVEVPVPQGGWEQLVSKSLSAECELHAAINPTYTSNIVVGAMGYGGTASLTFPIYYTKDHGRSWKKAIFTDQPVAGSLRHTSGGMQSSARFVVVE